MSRALLPTRDLGPFVYPLHRHLVVAFLVVYGKGAKQSARVVVSPFRRVVAMVEVPVH
jgi:hypothetical protein